MKQLSVKINGIDYFPGNTLSTTEEPLTECSVNYRALVNDKLHELGAFYEDDDTIESQAIFLHLSSEYANDIMFVRAGRVQEVLLGKAFYGGNVSYPLYLKIDKEDNWEEIYRLLLGNEHFINTGERGIEEN